MEIVHFFFVLDFPPRPSVPRKFFGGKLKTFFFEFANDIKEKFDNIEFEYVNAVPVNCVPDKGGKFDVEVLLGHSNFRFTMKLFLFRRSGWYVYAQWIKMY